MLFTLLPGMGLIQHTARRLQLETVADFNSFLRLKQAWDSLVASASEDVPIVTHDELRTWWEGSGRRAMQIIVVREGGAVVGIAPMLEDTERFYGFKLRKLSFIWGANVPRCDFIVAGRRRDIYRVLWEHIAAAQGHRWDLLVLPQLPEGSPTLTHFKELATASGFVVHTWSSDASHHWMFIYPNNPRTALFNAMKFRLAPLIQELGDVEGPLRKCA